MKTLLQVIEQKSNYISNSGLKFWWWAIETKIHRFYCQGFWSNQKKLQFTRPNKYAIISYKINFTFDRVVKKWCGAGSRLMSWQSILAWKVPRFLHQLVGEASVGLTNICGINNNFCPNFICSLLIIDMGLKLKIVQDSWKWIRFWKFGPCWVQ